MRSVLAMLLAVLVVGGFAVAASAQSPTQDAYGGVLGEQVGDDDTSAPGSTGGDGTSAPGSGGGETVLASQSQSASDGSLPFTGLDVALVALIGAGLVGLGFGLRWATRRTPI
jgi:hypothetical protein